MLTAHASRQALPPVTPGPISAERPATRDTQTCQDDRQLKQRNTRLMRARLLVQERAFERALEDFDAALALLAHAPLADEEMAKVHHERAEVLRMLDREEEAAAD